MTVNSFLKQFWQGQIDLQGIQLKLGESQLDLNEEQQKVLYQTAQKLEKEGKLIDASLDEIAAKIRNLDADTALKKIQEAFENKSMQLRLDKLASEIGVNKAQAKSLIESLIIARCGLEIQKEQNQIAWMTGAASADAADAAAGLSVTQTGALQFDLEVKNGKHVSTFAGQRYIWENSLIKAKTVHECTKSIVPFL